MIEQSRFRLEGPMFDAATELLKELTSWSKRIYWFVLLFVLITAVHQWWVGYDTWEDRRNLLACGDQYRTCLANHQPSCLADFGACRGPIYWTNAEEWKIASGE